MTTPIADLRETLERLSSELKRTYEYIQARMEVLEMTLEKLRAEASLKRWRLSNFFVRKTAGDSKALDVLREEIEYYARSKQELIDRVERLTNVLPA